MAYFDKISFIQVVVWSSAWYEFKGDWKEAELLGMNSDSSQKNRDRQHKVLYLTGSGNSRTFCFIVNERNGISVFFLGVGS